LRRSPPCWPPTPTRRSSPDADALRHRSRWRCRGGRRSSRKAAGRR
jgi:hypothetical protein